MAADWTICVIQICKQVDKFITYCVDVFICPIGVAKGPRLYFITRPTTPHSFEETSYESLGNLNGRLNKSDPGYVRQVAPGVTGPTGFAVNKNPIGTT